MAQHPPGVGDAAAATLTLAAEFLRTVALAAGSGMPGAGAFAAQAGALAERGRSLGEVNRAAYVRALEALERRDDGPGRPPLGPALTDAARTPLLLAEACADVAALGAQLALEAGPRLAPDAAGAAALASGAAAAAAQLVYVNLAMGDDDPLARRARETVKEAADAAAAAARSIA